MFQKRVGIRKAGKIRSGDQAADFIINALLFLVAFGAILPIWYVLVASVSDPVAIASGKVLIWPVGFNLEGYARLFATKKIWIGYRNSVIYTAAGILLDLLVQFPAAYALSVKKMPFNGFFSVFFVITMYFAGGTIPSYLLNVKLGLIDNPLVMIVPGCVTVFNLILIRNYMSSNISVSLFDAACIDGASYFKFFRKIVLPLCKPMIAIIALFSMENHWNTYLGAQMYLYSSKYQTLQQVIVQITSQLDTSLSDASRVSTELLAKQLLEKQLLKYSVVCVSILPMLIVYPLVQKFLITGIMLGAIKE